jgi:hypothetical protein
MFKCPKCEFSVKNINSLRIHASKRHDLGSQELYTEIFLGGNKPTCKCGCGTFTKFHGLSKGYSEYAWGHSAKVNNNWGNNEAAKEKSLAARREMWKNGEITVWCKGLTKEDPRVSVIITKMNTPERAQKIANALKGVNKSDSHKQKIAENMKSYWSCEENRAKQSRRQAECVKNGMLTKATREHGYFENPTKSTNTSVYYRSLFELNAIIFLEGNDDVTFYSVEPYRIEYAYEGKTRNYIIDYMIKYQDGRKVLVEIKPSCHTVNPINIAKFDAAIKFAIEHGMTFETWTEKTHPFLSNKRDSKPCHSE